MEEIQHLMQPIDTFQVVDTDNLNGFRFAANTVHVMLLALPHLFPPTTNLYDLGPTRPRRSRYRRSGRISTRFTASPLPPRKPRKPWPTRPPASSSYAPRVALRASCDACHALFLRPYHESKVSDADINFDFDSVLKNLKAR